MKNTATASMQSIREQFKVGFAVTVTNHYITRVDHPCYGTRQRIILKVSSSHITFADCGRIAWPKRSQIIAVGNTIQMFGGGLGQKPTDLFLTITL